MWTYQTATREVRTIMLPLRAPGGTGMLDWTPKPKTKIPTTVLEALPEPPVAALPVPQCTESLGRL